MAKQKTTEQIEIVSLRQKLEQEKRKVAAAELRAQEAEGLIRDFHASTFEIPKQKLRRAKKKGTKIIIAFGDTHGCNLDQDAWSALLSDIEHIKPDHIIHGGDILDCGGWLAQHHTTNYVAQNNYSYADEIVATNLMLDQLQETAPNAFIEIIAGNHDCRVETSCLTWTQKHRADSQFLLDLVGPATQLNLKKRGITWHAREQCHDDSVAGGTIKRGNCYFTHPQRAGGVNAARKMILSFKQNVVYFHIHRRDYASASNVRGEEWGAWCPGCMCLKRKYWHHSDHFEHNQGFHLQMVHDDGDFLGVNVPIIDGVSYLSDFISHVKL